MSARKLWVRIRGLPPDSATVHAAEAEDAPQEGAQGQPQQAGKVRYLEDIPVARSLREAGQFLQARNDEFSEMAQQAG